MVSEQKKEFTDITVNQHKQRKEMLSKTHNAILEEEEKVDRIDKVIGPEKEEELKKKLNELNEAELKVV